MQEVHRSDPHRKKAVRDVAGSSTAKQVAEAKATLFFRLGLPLQMIHRVKTKPASQASDDDQSDR